MKKILSKFKKYTFWVAFVGVFVLFLQNLAKVLGFDIDTTNIESAIMSFCGVLVVLGVVTKDSDQSSATKQQKNNQDVVELNIIAESTQVEAPQSNANDDSEIQEESITLCCNNNIDEPTDAVVVLDAGSDSTEQSLVESEKITTEKHLIDQEQNTVTETTQPFRDEVYDQMDCQNIEPICSEVISEHINDFAIKKLCPNCPFRQQLAICDKESYIGDSEQGFDAQSCQTDCAGDIMSKTATSQIVDPTYMPIE